MITARPGHIYACVVAFEDEDGSLVSELSTLKAFISTSVSVNKFCI